jgi:hypothetical protein
MTVKELLAVLQNADPEAPVFCGYSGNLAVTPAGGAMVIKDESQIPSGWHGVKVGDVVIFKA